MRQAKTRSTKNNLEFNLDSNFLLQLWERQSGKCALTNIEFDLCNTHKKDYTASPFSPSIDKINPKNGYTKDNVRLVCLAINYALNEFGEDIFKQICKAYLVAP